jgi:hypothetical protein
VDEVNEFIVALFEEAMAETSFLSKVAEGFDV